MASRRKFSINHRNSEWASLWVGAECGHTFPATGGRYNNSHLFRPALHGEVSNITGGGGGCQALSGMEQVGAAWGLLGHTRRGGSRGPPHSPSLYQEGVPPNPHLLLQVEPGKKAHFCLPISVGGLRGPPPAPEAGMVLGALAQISTDPGGAAGVSTGAHIPRDLHFPGDWV